MKDIWFNPDEDSWEYIERRRKPFLAPKGATRAILKRNMETSPLLSIPHEIRHRIWTYVLGEQILYLTHDHVKYFDERRWHLYRRPVPILDIKGAEIHCPDVHDVIPVRNEGKADVLISGDLMPELQIQRVCRQIYHEANMVLYGTNVFAFRRFVDLDDFLLDRSAAQKNILKHLCLEVDLKDIPLSPPNGFSSKVASIRTLRGLRTLHLHVKYKPLHQLETHAVRWSWTKALLDTAFFETCAPIYKLAIVPLQIAKIILVREPGLPKPSDLLKSWAKDLENRLLDPNGYETWLSDKKRAAQLQKERGYLERRMEYSPEPSDGDVHVSTTGV